MLINCDLGESLIPDLDASIMPLINMANIACGGHAGNDKSMVKTIKLAMQNKVKIGAHPSYVDKANFGRLSHKLDEDKLFDLIYQQVLNFQKLCDKQGAKLEYIKPHGALYHDMTHKQRVLDVFCKVIDAIDTPMSLVIQAGNQYSCNNNAVNFLYEVFADRGYRGTEIIPRVEQDAVFNDANTILKQYQHFLNNQTFKVDTICFHSDNPASVEALKRL